MASPSYGTIALGSRTKVLILDQQVFRPAHDDHARRAERTEAEFKALLTGAGFKFSRVVPTKSFVSVVEAIK
jgi:hypothetical protein